MDMTKISLNPAALAWRLSLIAALLVAAHVGLQMIRLLAHYDQHVWLGNLIDLDRERNIPALFSVTLLLAASLLLTLVAVVERRRRTLDASKWVLLAAGFLLMALDESASIHEGLIRPMRHLLGGQQLGIFYFAWVLPGIALVAALGAFFLPFLLRLPGRSKLAFAVSAAIYLGGALGVELIEGWYREGHGSANMPYHLLVSLEEGMEMAGIIMFIHALLAHISTMYGEVRLRFDGVGATAKETIEPTLEGKSAPM